MQIVCRRFPPAVAIVGFGPHQVAGLVENQPHLTAAWAIADRG
jgi:hypothetical protein